MQKTIFYAEKSYWIAEMQSTPVNWFISSMLEISYFILVWTVNIFLYSKEKTIYTDKTIDY